MPIQSLSLITYWAQSDHSSSQSERLSKNEDSDSSKSSPTRRWKSVKSLSDTETSSPEKKSASRSLYTQRQFLKPPKFDGSAAFKSFLVQFQNCNVFNKWKKVEQLAFLRGEL